MNTLKLGSLIRSTASKISSIQFLRCSESFASSSSIPKSRFFSNVTDGESPVYHHARLFRKPLSTRFRSNLSNSISLIGFVDRPFRVLDTEPDRFGVSTLLRVKDPRDPNRSFRIPLSMWDVTARKCVEHLKPNDFILVSGRLDSCSRNENSDLGLDYKVKVTEVNYVMAPPSHVLDSQIPQKPKPETVAREDGIEETKNDKIHLWQALFANPDEWRDNRRNNKNPSQPDFKHKETDEALWLDSDTPVWVTKQLESFDQREPQNDETHLWQALFANPDEWWDNRRNKKNPKQPDFKHKDTGEALWLHSSDTPAWITRQLESFGESETKNDEHLWQALFANPDEWWDNRRNKKNPKQPDFKHKDTGEALWLHSSDTPAWITRQLESFDESETKNDEHLWKALFANPDNWWDKRRNKKNPKQPDFMHKDTDEAIWLNSYTPDWVTKQLESFDQGVEETNSAEVHLWQVFFANPREWWDNRRHKTNPKQPDFKHKDTGEALWLDTDTPAWVTRQLELLDQRNANKRGYHQEETGRSSRLAEWI